MGEGKESPKFLFFLKETIMSAPISLNQSSVRLRLTITKSLILATFVIVALARPVSAPARADEKPAQINFAQGKIAFEFVGQATNFPPTPSAPLGSAHQYGFLTVVRGIDNVFAGSPHNETTALFTFFNEATTTESITNGPLRIVDRNGTTTIYLNTAPASFANPDSFRSGIPVLTSTLHQQAVNTPDRTFTTVFANTVSSTSAFTISGATFRLGQTGQAFRATVTGQSNATPPPNAHFGGYAVGVGGE